MKPKNMILLAVAIGCGLGASYLTSQLLANREKVVPNVKVLVAKKRLPGYTLIKDPEALTRFTSDDIVANGGEQGLEFLTWVVARDPR